MKSLANSSFAIVPNLRSNPSPHVSYLTPDLCFFLHCGNDQLRPNFRLSKIVQNNGIAPLRPSQTKEELKTEDLLDQQTSKELKNVHVKFQLQRKCKFREQFFIVGDDPVFGSWYPSDAIPMAWSEDRIWTAETGNAIWQRGSDRFIKTWEAVNAITVVED